MRALYDLGIYLIILGSYLRKKSRKQFFKRLGFGFPKIDKKERQLIWVHAVSLGETRAVAPLIRRLKSDLSNPLILLTTVTATGHEEGTRAIPEADYHLFLPFDLPYLITPIVKRVKPDLVVLVETDFWLHFQRAAKKAGSKIVLVNGKLSHRSFEHFCRFPRFARKLFSPIDHFSLQGKIYAKRFIAIGIPPEKITVTGNIKLDGLSEDKALDLPITKEDLVVTLGSTHDPEEKLLLNALKPLFPKFPNLKILLVPRHPERFSEVRKLLDDLLSPAERERVILVDKMGVLRSCYRRSALAFVGGSLTSKVGGHNILEPSYFGVPVLYGPYMHSQPDFLDLIQSYQAGVQVTKETLTQTLSELLHSRAKRQQLGANGHRLVQESSGALESSLKIISHLASNHVP